jgi:hypothetical protein
LKKSVTVDFKIEKGRLVYTGLDSFLNYHDGKAGSLTVKIVSNNDVSYWRHKYYRSALLPYIAEESYDSDDLKAHISLKKIFLFQNCTEFAEIPDKHRDERTMFYFTGDELTGYVPSLSNITDEEMRGFLLSVEAIMLELQISMSQADINMREKAFKKR